VALLLLLVCGVATVSGFQLGRREAPEWIQTLERPERVSGLKIDEILARLDLKPGMVIADIGSGSGVFSRPLAKAIAPSGRLIAVDIEPGLLSYVSERAATEGIRNIETHLAEPNDAKLGGQVLDMAFIHDVLHHIENRDIYLKNLAKYLKPTGRLALIEIDFTDPEAPHADQPEMQVSLDQIMQWTATAGLKPVQTFNLFPGKKHFIIFGLDPAR
jgi:ubiquinone/menaquinone biosynthesis C-methylase UbiE